MNSESIRDFLRHPSPGVFERLATGLLQRHATDFGHDDGPSSVDLLSEDLDWREAEPLSARLISQRDEAPAECETLEEVIRGHWRVLAHPPPARLLVMTGDSSTGARLLSVIRETCDDNGIVQPLRRGRIDSLAVRSWLGARQRTSNPAWIVTTSELGERLLQELERRRLRFRLPGASRFIQIGPSGQLLQHGRRRAVDISELLGIPPALQTFLVETHTLASLIEVGAGPGGSLRLASPPPWMRYRVLEPETGDTPRHAARFAVFDLATTLLPPFQTLDWPVMEKDETIFLASGA